ncbi:MAG: FIG00821051: hypothetical protein, partial [uncultured Nocardioides sp.]
GDQPVAPGALPLGGQPGPAPARPPGEPRHRWGGADRRGADPSAGRRVRGPADGDAAPARRRAGPRGRPRRRHRRRHRRLARSPPDHRHRAGTVGDGDRLHRHPGRQRADVQPSLRAAAV